MAVESVKYFTFKLNSLQFETIWNLFNHYDWNFDDCIVGEKKTFDTVISDQQLEIEDQSVQSTSSSANNSHQETSNHRHTGNNDDNGDDSDGGDDDNSESSDSESECRFCFCSPCVTTHRQLWLPNQPVRVHVRNSELRKQKYRKFWKIMDTKGAWRHPKYLRKKGRLLGVEDLSTVWTTVGTIREVMPQCILELVRGIYPNPPGQPYMGHKWW